MATVSALHIVQSPQPMDTWEGFIARIGTALSVYEQRGDQFSWEKAQLVIDADGEAASHPEMRGKKRWEVHHRVTQGLRKYWTDQRLPHPQVSFLSHARKLYQVWDDVFAFESKKLPYQQYSQLAVNSLPREEKDALRTWAETEKPTQAQLRQRIRDCVDAMQGVSRPDFDVKVSNHWMFNGDKRGDGFEGGVNYELYANLIHAFSDPGDTILDPFAGGGILADTLQKYRHFQEVTQAEHSGPRFALMSDISPTREGIQAADVRVSLPFPSACAKLAILDPPYLTIASGKYAELGRVLSEWQEGLSAALIQTARCLTPDGLIVVMTDDHLRKSQHIPLGHKVTMLLEKAGWQLITTIYNFNRNFLSMSPLAMAGTKHARFFVNAVKTLQVACRAQVCR